MACSLANISNRTNGFEFVGLYNVYTFLNQTCGPSSEIFFEGTRMLTCAACEKIAGMGNSIWTDWTPYPISDIWNRIVVWKLPLLQLLSQFPRPPLGPWVETGVMMHLLGDPIDSVTCMFLTLANCQRRARRAKSLSVETGIGTTHPDYTRTWKELAIIMVSYDECGTPEKVDVFLEFYREMARRADFIDEIRYIYEEAAGSLAADRQTRTLPVVLAEVFFIGGWVISLIKAAATEPSPTNWVNVEAQSIAISALYLWVTSTIILGSLIGASQTEDAIPRVLHSMEFHLAPFQRRSTRRPSIAARVDTGWCRRSIDRAIHGCAYSWQPLKWKAKSNRSTLFAYAGVATVFVGVSFFTSATISYLVSPEGFSCRHIPESIVFIIWVLSFLIQGCCERVLHHEVVFQVLFWKDVFCAMSNIGIIVIVQWGIMNRCSCWAGMGSTWVHLPQLPKVKGELMYYIRHVAPFIVFVALMFHFLFCAAVIWKYRDAIRVFIQRDDGVSNMSWRSQVNRKDEKKADAVELDKSHSRNEV
ncbi:hypothetical protein BKA63DRAFT_4313 [Paraphoma chrysanthemicola]|nr:hypothetical protein BKA63DRAFT_4313 [Paraphoma chrysanthemicola]